MYVYLSVWTLLRVLAPGSWANMYVLTSVMTMPVVDDGGKGNGCPYWTIHTALMAGSMDGCHIVDLTEKGAMILRFGIMDRYTAASCTRHTDNAR